MNHLFVIYQIKEFHIYNFIIIIINVFKCFILMSHFFFVHRKTKIVVDFSCQN